MPLACYEAVKVLVHNDKLFQCYYNSTFPIFFFNIIQIDYLFIKIIVNSLRYKFFRHRAITIRESVSVYFDKTSKGKTPVENIRAGKIPVCFSQSSQDEVAEVESNLELRFYTDNVEKKNERKHYIRKVQKHSSVFVIT